MVRVLFILGQYCNLWLRRSFKGRERNWGEKNDRRKTGVKKKRKKKGAMEGSHLLCGNGPVLSTGVGGLLPPTPYPTSHPPNPTPLTSLPPPPLILLFGCSCRMGGRQGEVDGCKVKENLNLQIVTNTNYVILEGSVWSSYLDRYNVSTGKNTTAT